MGDAGPTGPQGPPGAPGSPGADLSYAGAGLDVTVQSARIRGGKAVVEFTVRDDDGRLLDREGKLTAGSVSLSFIIAWLGEDAQGASTKYTAYTLRDQTSPVTEITETQSSAESNGTFEAVGSRGEYRYTFATAVNPGDRASHTHTIGIFATRSVDGTRYVDNEIYHFVPAGTEVTTTLDIIDNSSCNNCHTRVEAHGGARRGIEMCNLCHTEANSIDPDTGNTIDMHVMIHKIHMGANLPSVRAGEPYQIIGHQQSVHDYSHVQYPGDLAYCAGCHSGSQGDRWETRLSIRSCASCHDRTYFGSGETPEGFTRHTAGPRTEAECIVCHAADSISPVWLSHRAAFDNPDHTVSFELVEISQTQPDQTPVLTFGAFIDGEPAALEDFNRVRMVIAGPNSDYVEYWQEDIVGVATCNGADPTLPCVELEGSSVRFHASQPIPSEASGSYTVALEGRADVDDVRYYAQNPTLAFAVTDSHPNARRQVVGQAQCNSCHQDLGFHGNNRKSVDYCVMCHNPTLVGGDTPSLGGASDASSVNFKDLIHRVHNQVGYPDTLVNCAHCHVGGSTSLPTAGLAPSLAGTFECQTAVGESETQELCPSEDVLFLPAPAPPETAACTSCHSAPATAAHAEVNTTASGAEACATCHGTGKSVAVEAVHQLSP